MVRRRAQRELRAVLPQISACQTPEAASEGDPAEMDCESPPSFHAYRCPHCSLHEPFPHPQVFPRYEQRSRRDLSTDRHDMMMMMMMMIMMMMMMMMMMIIIIII